MELEKIAEDLLFPLWRCLSPQYKQKYRDEAWQHFQNQVTAAANSQDLKMFLTPLRKQLEIRVQKRFIPQILSVLQHKDGGKILNDLRKNVDYLILVAQSLNEQLKEDRYENLLYDMQLDYDFSHEDIEAKMSEFEGSYKKTYEFFVKHFSKNTFGNA